jgi:hypothetical protein
MTGWGFGWRTAAVVFLVLSTLFVVGGLIAVQVDDQYSSDPVLQRSFVGVFGGLYGAALLSPITLVVAAIVGAVAGLVHARRRRLAVA